MWLFLTKASLVSRTINRIILPNPIRINSRRFNQVIWPDPIITEILLRTRWGCALGPRPPSHILDISGAHSSRVRHCVSQSAPRNVRTAHRTHARDLNAIRLLENRKFYRTSGSSFFRTYLLDGMLISLIKYLYYRAAALPCLAHLDKYPQFYFLSVYYGH